MVLQRSTQQWITGPERVAATWHFVENNWFGSFAPIRLNVSAQWLRMDRGSKEIGTMGFKLTL
jgi:hypothetical protein